MKRIFPALVLLAFSPTLLAGGAPKVHNTTAAVACSPNPVALNAASTCTVTVTDLGGQGPDTPPAGSVNFTSSGTGSFSAASCTLVPGASATSSCQVTYTPTLFGAGTHTITADYDGGADPDPSTGIVFNPSSGSVDLAISYPAITITSISPAIGNRGEAVDVTITGSNFVAGATSLDLGANITVSSLAVTSSTGMTATLTIAVAAPTGFRDVTVANPAPGGGTDTLVNGFEVRNPPPVIAALTPAAVEEGAGAMVVTIDGNGFVSDSVAYFNGVARATTFINSTQLQISLTAADTATIGDYPVTVVNAAPGGGTSNAATFSVVASGGSFDAVELNAALGTTLYTRLAGVSFNVDILATEISRLAVEPSFTGTVKVELLDAGDDSAALDASGCRASWSVVQTLPDATFTSGDNGRITVSAGYSNALRVARFRISYPATGTPTHVGCSSDPFSIRPLSLAVSTPLDNELATGTPLHDAGTAFSITASAIPGYDGTPAVNAALLSVPAAANVSGVLAGSFPSADVASGTSTGNAFTYDEVGNFTLAPRGIYDSTFTAVDQPGDCAAGFSNTPTGGKYGCSFGSTVDLDVGRFVPAYFDVQVADACTVDGFTYSNQPFEVVVTAREAGGSVTDNYAGPWARDVTLSDAGDASGFVDPTNVIPALDFELGTAPGIATNPDATYAFSAPNTSFRTITLRATDPDGVSSAGHLEESTEIRSGRFVIDSVTAITTDDALVGVRVEAWQETSPGMFEWAVHADDTACTTPVQASFSVGGELAGLTSITGFFFNAGTGALTLSAPGPGNDGTADVDVVIGTWLYFDQDSDGVREAPHGTVTFFEIFATEPGFIDRHEVVP